MAETSEERRERKLRRLAKDMGYELCVSRTFYVTELDEAGIPRLVVHNLMLDDMEKWLREAKKRHDLLVERRVLWEREHKAES